MELRQGAIPPVNPPQWFNAVDPIRIDSFNQLLLQVGDQLRRHGWALVATEVQGIPYQYTLGLSLKFGHPDLEVIGLTPDLGQTLLENLVGRIMKGERLKPGEFLSDLKKGYDFFLVENPIDPDGPPVTGGRLRLIWPDAQGRFPWHADCEAYCASQSLLLEGDGIDTESLERVLHYTPIIS